MAVMTGLSGNEMFCLHLKGLTAGDLVIGNSVFSMGVLGSLAAAGRNLLGGEVSQITQIIHEGRLEAFQRMVKEAEDRGGAGITGVTNELRTFHGNTEFYPSPPLSIAKGPAGKRSNSPPAPMARNFTVSSMPASRR